MTFGVFDIAGLDGEHGGLDGPRPGLVAHDIVRHAIQVEAQAARFYEVREAAIWRIADDANAREQSPTTAPHQALNQTR